MPANRSRSRPEKPLAKEIAVFVKHHLADKHVFAPFTGQDYSAWAAFLYACQLYGRSDTSGQANAIIAMRACADAAQQKPDVQAVFKKSIPGVLDWGFEHSIWSQISLTWPCLDGERVCHHERSKPVKRTSSYSFIGEVPDEEWLDCLDCEARWRPRTNAGAQR